MPLTNNAPRLTPDQLEELVIGAQNDRYQWPELREGQSLMNKLYDVSPELYVELTASNIDPFYNDKHLDAFMNYIIG